VNNEGKKLSGRKGISGDKGEIPEGKAEVVGVAGVSTQHAQ
jgi:hypothetical protein